MVTLSVASSDNSLVFRHEASENKRCCPNTGKSDQSVDYLTHYGSIAVKEPAYDVEAENSYAAPNESSDNGKGKGNFVDYVHCDQYLSLFYKDLKRL